MEATCGTLLSVIVMSRPSLEFTATSTVAISLRWPSNKGAANESTVLEGKAILNGSADNSPTGDAAALSENINADSARDTESSNFFIVTSKVRKVVKATRSPEMTIGTID